MPYLLLIMEPHGQRAERGLAGGQEAYARMQRFGAGLQARGLLRASESLASTEQAVRLQVRDGQTRLTDGPFAETKEMVGGFFLIDCATREEAAVSYTHLDVYKRQAYATATAWAAMRRAISRLATLTMAFTEAVTMLWLAPAPKVEPATPSMAASTIASAWALAPVPVARSS